MTYDSEKANDHKADEYIPASHWGNEIVADEAKIKRNLLEIENKIAPLKPRIIGVTKYFGLDAIKCGYEAGLRNFGESRVLDAVQKIEQLPEEIRQNSSFHFIGHLQTNKVKKAVEYFDYIHSVDSLKLAEAISDSACFLNKREKVLLQVNNSGEIQKYGYSKEGLLEDFSKIINLKGIDVIGLMCMAPLGAPEELLRKLFSDIRRFKEELQTKFGVNLTELSMGMSDDYQIASEEGATMIRIGRKIFR